MSYTTYYIIYDSWIGKLLYLEDYHGAILREIDLLSASFF